MRSLVGVIAAAAIATMFVLPVRVQRSRSAPPPSRRNRRRPRWTVAPLGRMRTCGFDYLQYDGLGTPYGPYCH
jgi:hypothetical protein